jgi:hypothetical protein
MTEADYIRSLGDEDLTRYLLGMCITFAAGLQGVPEGELDLEEYITEPLVIKLLQSLQQPHKEVTQ